MSYYRTVWIYCDGDPDCTVGYEHGQAATELNHGSAAEARAELAKDGWQHKGRFDLCPNCQEAGYRL